MEAKLTLTIHDDFENREYSIPISVYVPLALKNKLLTYFRMCADEMKEQILLDLKRHRTVYGIESDTVRTSMEEIVRRHQMQKEIVIIDDDDYEDEITTKIEVPLNNFSHL